MIKIEDIDHYGNGIGYINNKVVFVKRSLPGEVVDIRIIKDKKNYSEAIISSIIEKSNDRIEPKCPYYDNCGGCNLLHMSYNKQLEFKENKIKNIVSKYLGNIKVNHIVSTNEFNYRNKVTFQVKEKIGFYKEKSYELIKIDNCLLLDDKINSIIPILNKLSLSKISKITVKCFNDKLMVIFDNEVDIESIKNYFDSIYIKDKLIYGSKYLKANLGNYEFYIGANTFFQVNIDTTLKLYDKIKSYINEKDNVLDLYCGIGSIGIYTNKSNNTIGIEIVDESIESANENNKLNNTNIKFICSDASLITNIKDINTVIIDPPRSGLNKDTINNIIKLNPDKIIYVSCDPMTLVRDLKILSDNYNIIEITPFDMFPNTYHVESVVLLSRK